MDSFAASFTVPFSDDQIEVDGARKTVSLFRNAWNRESSGYPDETWTFAELQQDSALRASVLGRLAQSDAATLERRLASES